MQKLTEKQQEEFNRQHMEYRHYRNRNFIGFKVFRLIKRQLFKNKKLIKQMQKENERLQRVIMSKEKFKNYQDPNGFIEFKDELLKSQGIFSIGLTMNGKPVLFDFNISPNVLCGGAPGGGKTNLILLVSYQAILHGCDVNIADFKGTDFIEMESKCNVIYDHKELVKKLKELHSECKTRKDLFRQFKAGNLKEYNQRSGKGLKRVYMIIDELAEAMEIIDVDIPNQEKKDIEKDISLYLKSIARLGRAYGVNLFCGTQRPDVDVIKGNTRDMFIERICFQSTRQTSQIVLEDSIASDLNKDNKGRAYIKDSNKYIEVQTYYFDKNTIVNLPNINQNKSEIEEKIDQKLDKKTPKKLVKLSDINKQNKQNNV